MSILVRAAEVRPFSCLFHLFDVIYYLSSSSLFAKIESCLGGELYCRRRVGLSILFRAVEVRFFSCLFHLFDVIYYLSSSSWLSKIQCCLGGELHCRRRVGHVYLGSGCRGLSFLL